MVVSSIALLTVCLFHVEVGALYALTPGQARRSVQAWHRRPPPWTWLPAVQVDAYSCVRVIKWCAERRSSLFSFLPPFPTGGRGG